MLKDNSDNNTDNLTINQLSSLLSIFKKYPSDTIYILYLKDHRQRIPHLL